ncbi:endonuclease/exonuclease/phosphatase family protein [Sphingomicrobium clamense]|uniref:Endonuclease/exonuclease/phosphatase family protein n=1 Tax=Sphingomicrobium clamense TaxID=2851013 RepID=A0ABS6V7Q1_9SPHN|nr:endonuclease/exonuclease/phosphatase family protein [Sphingomicrobium sp. B8]MBW0145370.1 endonuclease/exonuclease/phosphatase family protein [Sphingomicrobium sp. B8]
MISSGPHYVGWRRWFIRGLGAFALFLVVAAFIPAWQTDLWFIRLFDFPRMQLGFAGIFVAILYAILVPDWRHGRSLFVLSTLVIATLWQFTHAARFLFFYPKEVASADQCPADRQLSLLGANVLIDNDDYAAMLETVRAANADVVLLTESDAKWEEAMRPIEADYPHRIAIPLDNAYGMHLYSKLPFDGAVKFRLQGDIPSIDGTLTLRDGSEVHLFAVHPEPPLPGDDAGERDAELVLVGRDMRDRGGASIVLGDLNDVAWSKTTKLFIEVSGTRDPRVGRRLMPTFNAKWPLLRWPLDHLFVSPHWDHVDMDRLDASGSDHFPVLFTTCLARDADERLVAPRADEDTEEEATEQLQEGIEETVTEEDGEKR